MIRRDKEDNIYANLHRQALDDLQALSGNRWTDFNAHDPGVTILENALYALMEMQYRLQFPFEAFLSAKSEKKYAHYGLFPAGKIAEPSLVTSADYEKWFTGNVPELSACRVNISDNGKYIIRAEIKAGADESEVRKRIFELYHAHRNLCETLDTIVFETEIAPGDDANPVPDDAPQFVPPASNEKPGYLLPTEYYSFQRHFPDTYGVNEKGAPAGSSPQRKAQILQLKAYLLIFDYLLANILHQEGNITALLHLSDMLPPPYRLNFSIENMDKLVDSERFENNNLYNAEFWREQKSGLLDVLDMLYGEDTKTLSADRADLHRANEKRAYLIHHFLQWNTDRFRSFNLLMPDTNNVPAIAGLAAAVFDNKAVDDIYWVEHILLGDYPEERHRLTVALYAHNQLDTEKLESFIRERLPAHLGVYFLWMDNSKISGFWKIHLLWRKALQQQNGEKIALYGAELHELIVKS